MNIINLSFRAFILFQVCDSSAFNYTHTPKRDATYGGVSIQPYRKFVSIDKNPEEGDDDSQVSPPSAMDLVFEAAASQSIPAKGSGRMSVRTEEIDDQKYDVIIIGAGWAGMTAALELQKNNVTFKVLEARDYVGGRSQTTSVDGMEFNTGSMWLQEGTCNPLYSVANYTGADLIDYSVRYQLWDEMGPISDQDYQQYTEALYNWAWQRYTWSKMYLVDEDEQLSVATDEVLSLIDKYSNAGTRKKILKAILESWVNIPYGADMDRMSLFYGQDGSYICGGDWKFVSSPFSKIIDTYTEPVKNKIQTEAVVKTINYTKKNIKIKYEDRFSENVVDRTISAKKVIVTVPLGVLKKKGINFIPDLPDKTWNGIRGIGMGKQVRAFMFWDDEDRFWPHGPDHISNTEMIESKVLYHVSSSLHNDTTSQLIAVMTSPEALELEKKYAKRKNTKKYEEELMKLAMIPLRRMFGEDISNPKRTFATKWNVDEFSYGIYSFNKVGHLPSFRKRLKEPIQDKIFFAGEATSSKFYGTLHGEKC